MTDTAHPTITCRCPDCGTDPMRGCGHIFTVANIDSLDDMVDCPNCGLFFDPSHPNNQPQPPGTVEAFAAHLAAYRST